MTIRGIAARPERNSQGLLPDYIVRIGTPDLESYETFVTDRLGAVPGIARVDSHLTMKVVKSPDRQR